MLKYSIKRILLFPITLLVISMLIFFLINMSHVDPTSTILPSTATQEDRDALREKLGLNDPLIVQYGNWLVKAVRGDLGNSWYNNTSVSSELLPRMAVTAKLALYTTLLSMLLGIPLGIICAVKQYSVVDTAVNAGAMCIASMPNFFMSLILMLFFSIKLGLLPIYGISDWKGWILPIVTLGVQSACNFVRVTRSCMLDCIRQDYVNTARSMGNKERRVIYHHTLRNAMLPLITLTGQQFASMMGGAIVVETVFAIPGLGMCIVQAINTKDIPLVLGATMLISLIFLIASLVIDLLYSVADPRVRSAFAGKKRKRAKTVSE